MLVDNSIIVLENIFRQREEGAPAMEAAARGGEEVAGAITASTLTTIAVFAPIVYVEGVAGELFRDLSLAVAFSLLFSLLVALTILPTIAARFRVGPRPETTGPGPLLPGPRPSGFFRTAWWGVQTLGRFPFWLLNLGKSAGLELLYFWWGEIARPLGRVLTPVLRAFDRGYDRFAAWYHALLEKALDRRAVVLAISFVALGGSLLAGTALDRDLLQRVEQGAFDIEFALAEGTALFRTDEVAREVENILLNDPDVEAVFGTVGRDIRRLAQGDETTGLHTAHFQVRLAEGAETEATVERLRPSLENAVREGEIAILSGQATALGQMMGGTDADIAVRIRGENIAAAFDYAELVIAALHGTTRVTNARAASERGQSRFDVQIQREEAARYGIQAASVSSAVGEAMRGIRTSNDFVAFDRKIPVFVRLPDRLRYDVETIERLRVSGVPLRELIQIDFGTSPTEIRRENQGRVVTVLADVRRGGLDQAIAEVDEVLASLPAPQELRVEVGGENEEMRRSFRDLAFAFALAMALVYMILAAQFESFLHPGTILAAVPLALIGALLALLVTGHGLNTMSLIGIVILIGIAVNDAIVKVDFIVQARTRGASTRAAILEAGRVRLRPILMTTITTVLGLTPMALGLGRGADLRAPLAVAVIGGLIVATFLTLIVVPVLYSLVEDVRLVLAGGKETGA
jgi:HAE1 family hydrophobic/amphiphilic exporter-1